jgi:hypothetical protein
LLQITADDMIQQQQSMFDDHVVLTALANENACNVVLRATSRTLIEHLES